MSSFLLIKVFVDLRSTVYGKVNLFKYFSVINGKVFIISRFYIINMIVHKRITIVEIRRPAKGNVNDELQWFGSSLGLFNIRDKDSSCFRVFIELLKASKNNTALSSDELAYKLGLSRGTVVHHLNKLAQAGILKAEKNRYSLRVENLSELIKELQKDIQRNLAELQEVAKEIDDWLS